MNTNVESNVIDGTNLGSCSHLKSESTSNPSQFVESLDVFGESECGRPLSTQNLTINFTPTDDLDSKTLQKKCCSFWTFIHSRQELQKLMIVPDPEVNVTTSSCNMEPSLPVRSFDGPLSEDSCGASAGHVNPSAACDAYNAFSMLQFVEGKGLIDRVFEAKLQKKQCSLGSREYVYSERNTKTSGNKMFKFKTKSQDQGKPARAPGFSTSSTHLKGLCDDMQEWDSEHPKDFGAPTVLTAYMNSTNNIF